MLYGFFLSCSIDQFSNCLLWEGGLGILFSLCRLCLILVFSLLPYPTFCKFSAFWELFIAKNKQLVSCLVLIALYIGFPHSCGTSPLLLEVLYISYLDFEGNLRILWIVIRQCKFLPLFDRSKSLCSNTAFQPLFLLPCSTWQMTFLFLIQSPGHTQGYSQCDASEWERHSDGINLNPFLHVKKKEPCPLQTFHIY